jgi:hypothetical protein
MFLANEPECLTHRLGKKVHVFAEVDRLSIAALGQIAVSIAAIERNCHHRCVWRGSIPSSVLQHNAHFGLTTKDMQVHTKSVFIPNIRHQ